MDKISLALQLILSLSILVVLHELGHYLPAIWFKTRVEKFYLFFDPYFSLVKKKIGDTEWGIGWIPFGGYVKISGMIDESMDKEQMKQPPQPWEFRSKKAWQRLIIMVGGVTVNFLLGILLFAMIAFYWGESYLKTQDAKYGIAVDSLGMKLGLKDGDLVLAVGDTEMERFNPGLVTREIIINQAKTITVKRDNQTITLPIDAEVTHQLTKYDNKSKSLYFPRLPFEIAKVDTTGAGAKYGLQDGMKILAVNQKQIQFQNEFVNALKPLKNGIGSFKIINEKGDTSQRYIAIPNTGKIGIAMTPSDKFLTSSIQEYGFFQSFPKGWNMSVGFLQDQLKAFGRMFNGSIKPTEALGSVFSIASMFDSKWNWRVFWNLTASLSIMLAFMNLLPIPALDGGYVVFLIWEVITGKVPSDRFMEVVNYIGFILLMGLMIFALGLDISRWF